jgi:hypothetical protein
MGIYNTLDGDLRRGVSMNNCRIGSYRDLCGLYGCVDGVDLSAEVARREGLQTSTILKMDEPLVVGVMLTNATRQREAVYVPVTVGQWRSHVRLLATDQTTEGE